VVEYFHQHSVTFDTSPVNAGIITPASGWFNATETISILDLQSASYAFSKWSSSPSSILIADVNKEATTSTIDGTGSITADFSPRFQQVWPRHLELWRCMLTSKLGKQFLHRTCLRIIEDNFRIPFGLIWQRLSSTEGRMGFSSPFARSLIAVYLEKLCCAILLVPSMLM
jgi:hypothetical protein